MKKFFSVVLAGCLGVGLLAAPTTPADAAEAIQPERAAPNAIIRPQDMADALRDVIAAERAVYTKLVVHRLQDVEKVLKASPDWEADRTLVDPCQKLRLAAEAIQTKGAEFSYTLRSLSPVSPRNAPQTEVERVGLEAVARQPGTNYYARETLGGRRYLTAVYPDKALSPACVTCHNRHPLSPRKDWKPDEVMGGLVIRVALEF